MSVSLAWTEFGDPAGKPVVFFHGWPSSKKQGAPFQGVGQKRGWRIIAPDRPGMGKSPMQPGRRFGDWVATLARLLDESGIDRCPVIGMSGGGPYALASVAGLANRVTAAAVICGAPPLADKQDREKILPELRRVAWLSEVWPEGMRWGFVGAGWAMRLVDEASARRLAQLSAKGVDAQFFYRSESINTIGAGLEAWAQGGRGVYAEGQLYLQAWDFLPESILRPVAIWHGSEDSLFHWSLAEKLSRRIPGASFHLMPGCGHFEAIHTAQEATFDWLETLDVAASS